MSRTFQSCVQLVSFIALTFFAAWGPTPPGSSGLFLQRGLLALLFSIPLSSCGTTAQTTTSAHGIDVAGMDRSMKPGDDFFKFANGTWDKNTPIPPDRASWGVDGMLDEEATAHTRELLEGTAARQAAAG